MARTRWSVAAILIASTAIAGTSPVGAQSPSASPIDPVGSPAGSLAPSASVAPGEVVSVSDGPGFTDSFAYGAAAAPDGALVMVGQHLDRDPAVPPGAAAWHSMDGSTWTEVALPQPKKALSLDVAVSALGWAAIGFVPNGASLLWTSADGISWVRSKALRGGQPQTIIATKVGFLVGGQNVVKGVARPVLWQSGDLLTWKRLKLPGKGLVLRLAQTPSGVILALVMTASAKGTTYRYLRSLDAATWQTVDFAASSSGTDVLSAAELGTAGDLFVQVIDRGPAAGPFVGSVLTSADGLAWDDAWTAQGSLFAVASGQVVNVFGGGIQVSSPDGITWTETERPEILLTTGATSLPDGRSLVLDNSNTDPPSVVVQIIPAVVVPPATSPASSASPGASAAP